MELYITAFAQSSEFKKAEAALKRLSLPYSIVSPNGYSHTIDVPAIVVNEQSRQALYSATKDDFVCAGWIEYHPSENKPLDNVQESFRDDIFGKAHMMVVQPCVAAPEKIRFTAHLSGDLSPVFPYLNAIMPNAFYNAKGQTFTFMDGYRMITAYPKRVAAAKADDIVDAWRVLADIRIKANDCWAKRAGIAPFYEMRRKPPALEIYNRLPKTNCGTCGEKTCMAFAFKLSGGEGVLTQCIPVFGGSYSHLKDALVEICGGFDIKKE
jgi:ArsR family metal-binding transcriptional regulator